MRRPLVLALATVLLAASGTVHARSLERQLGDAAGLVGISGGSAFDALAANIADTSARSLPVIAASAGFTYRYNPALEVFERTSETLGPLFVERPDTLGRNKVNVSVSFQYVQFDRFDGDKITRLENPDPIIIRDASGTLHAVRLRYSLGIQSYVTAVSATWGVLDNLDLNFLVPIVMTDLRTGVHAGQVAQAPAGGAFSPAPLPEQAGHSDGRKTGVGDILVRSKYQLPTFDWLRSALGLQLRLPSGTESNFQGTGDVEVSPFLYLSTVLWERVEPNLNLGLDYRTDDVSKSDARYDAGVDVDVTRTFNLNLAFLGRSELGRSANAADTSFLHLHGGQAVSEPLLGLDFGRKDFFDLSFGLRWVVWRNLMLYANGIYALNSAGLRNDTIIPSGGIEGTF